MKLIPRDMDGRLHYEQIDWQWIRFHARFNIRWRYYYWRWRLLGIETPAGAKK